MFSCEICEIFKNAFFYRQHWVAASGNISWALPLLHLRTMNGVISWYALALQRLFNFTACVSFLSIFFFSSHFFSWILLLFGFQVSLSILKIKQWSCSYVPKRSFEGWVASALFSNWFNWLCSVWEKFELHLTSTCLLELLAAEYLRETNISIFIFH